jgi:hypothetical protein
LRPAHATQNPAWAGWFLFSSPYASDVAAVEIFRLRAIFFLREGVGVTSFMTIMKPIDFRPLWAGFGARGA